MCGGRGKSHEPAGVGRSRGNEHGGRKKEETCVHGCVVQSLRVAFSETLGRRLCLPFQSSTAPTKLGNMWRIKLSYKRIGRSASRHVSRVRGQNSELEWKDDWLEPRTRGEDGEQVLSAFSLACSPLHVCLAARRQIDLDSDR